jgi:mannose-6-phosphate isomerase-like protein (cupin superfamily)
LRYWPGVIYIGEGEMTFIFPEREVLAGPGSFVFVPRGVKHTAHITKPLLPNDGH